MIMDEKRMYRETRVFKGDLQMEGAASDELNLHGSKTGAFKEESTNGGGCFR